MIGSRAIRATCGCTPARAGACYFQEGAPAEGALRVRVREGAGSHTLMRVRVIDFSAPAREGVHPQVALSAAGSRNSVSSTKARVSEALVDDARLTLQRRELELRAGRQLEAAHRALERRRRIGSLSEKPLAIRERSELLAEERHHHEHVAEVFEREERAVAQKVSDWCSGSWNTAFDAPSVLSRDLPAWTVTYSPWSPRTRRSHIFTEE